MNVAVTKGVYTVDLANHYLIVHNGCFAFLFMHYVVVRYQLSYQPLSDSTHSLHKWVFWGLVQQFMLYEVVDLLVMPLRYYAYDSMHMCELG